MWDVGTTRARTRHEPTGTGHFRCALRPRDTWRVRAASRATSDDPCSGRRAHHCTESGPIRRRPCQPPRRRADRTVTTTARWYSVFVGGGMRPAATGNAGRALLAVGLSPAVRPAPSLPVTPPQLPPTHRLGSHAGMTIQGDDSCLSSHARDLITLYLSSMV